MSWLSQLYLTYENFKNTPGVVPIGFVQHKVQLEVTITEEGEFCNSRLCDKGQGAIIPATRESQMRTSGIEPYPLSDQIQYLAGDLKDYYSNSKNRKKAETAYASYMRQLEDWKNSEFTHFKVNAIYTYLSKKTLVKDLIDQGTVSLNADKSQNDKSSIDKVKNSWVVFRVLSDLENTSLATGDDTTLKEAFEQYIFSRMASRDLPEDICYLSGKLEPYAETHPYAVGKLKLISSNDDKNFTFRGRFIDAHEAYSLGDDASQKIHIALNWLIENYGIKHSTEDTEHYFICWSPENVNERVESFEMMLENTFQDQGENIGSDNSALYEKLKEAIYRGRNSFSNSNHINVMILGAPSQGRIAITHYNEFLANDFFDTLTFWNETCHWWIRNGKEYISFTPTFISIVKYAFGSESGAQIKITDKLKNSQFQRVLSIMLDHRPLANDLVLALSNKASNLSAYSYANRERLLSIACAVIAKHNFDTGVYKEGDLDSMKLDTAAHDRSYLFGRLLAIFEKVERSTYRKAEDKSREPNAIRLQAEFVMHPLATWKSIETLLIPYYQKLNPGSRFFYKSLISEIVEQFDTDDPQRLNRQLKESYLLGYYLQRAELYNKPDNSQENAEGNKGEEGND